MPKTRTATEILLEQHRQLEEMFRDLAHATGPARAELFDCLRATVAVHETAEQLIVHPMVRTAGDDAERIVEARMAEEADAEALMAVLEDLGPHDPRFDTELARFERAVLAHAEAEERELFPLFEEHFDQGKQERAARRIELAEELAPTHAHPHSPDSPVGLALTGPFLSMVDRVRDAMSG